MEEWNNRVQSSTENKQTKLTILGFCFKSSERQIDSALSSALLYLVQNAARKKRQAQRDIRQVPYKRQRVLNTDQRKALWEETVV